MQTKPEFLYHSTSVNTLERILKNKTIRFNSLDNLDEGKSQEITPYRRFTYISCWTNNQLESIPMWSMYASLQNGVRIKMRSYPFKKYDAKLYSGIISGADKLQDYSPHRYLIMPLETFIRLPYTFNIIYSENSLFKVNYTNNEVLLNPQLLKQNKKGVSILHGKLGKYKNEYWNFQDEWRYIFNLMPRNCIELTRSKDEYVNMLNDMVNPEYLSPSMESKTIERVEELKRIYNPNMKITKSILTGKIR